MLEFYTTICPKRKFEMDFISSIIEFIAIGSINCEVVTDKIEDNGAFLKVALRYVFERYDLI